MPLPSLKEAFGSATQNTSLGGFVEQTFSIAADRVKKAFIPEAPEKAVLANEAFMDHMRAVLDTHYTGQLGETPDMTIRTSLHGGIASRDRMAAAAIALKGAPLELSAKPGAWAMLAKLLMVEGRVSATDIKDKAAFVAKRALQEEGFEGLLASLRLVNMANHDFIDNHKAEIATALSRVAADLCAAPLTAEQAQDYIASFISREAFLRDSAEDALRQLRAAGVAGALRDNDPLAAMQVLRTGADSAGHNFKALSPDTQLQLMNHFLDGMEFRGEPFPTEHFQWYQRMAAHMAPQPGAVAAAMDERYIGNLRRVLPDILYEKLTPGPKSYFMGAQSIIESFAPGRDILNEALGAVIDRHIAENNPDRALAIAVDTQLRMMRGPVPPLTEAQAQAMADSFTATGRHDRSHALAVLMGQEPSVSALMDVDAEDIVRNLAPILSGAKDDDAHAFAQFVRAVPLAEVAAAQADMLAPVWDAFERAAPKLKPLGKGRPEGGPVTAAEMHDLSLAVAGYMAVSQTQLPVIMPADWSAATTLNEFAGAEQVMSADLSFSDYSVRGSAIYAMANGDDGRTHPIGFSFLTARRLHSVEVEGQRMVKESLLSLPVISLDAGVLKNTMDHGGEGVVRAAQEIAGIFNHDYFHHFTAAIINPYYSHANGLTFGDTPYGVLEREIEEQRAADRNHFNVSSAAAKPSREYLYARWTEYGQNDHKWPVFGSSGANYEGHAMHMHNRLYREYMDDGPAGVALRQHIDDCGDGVATLGENLTAAGKSPRAVAETKFYYASYLTFNLRRLVPLDHPVMQHTEKAIARMNIDPEQCRAIVRDITGVMRDTDYHKRLANVSDMAAVDPDDDKLDPVAAARWNGIRMSVNVLNMLYMDKYADAQAKSLPALKEVLAVIDQDLAFMDKAGGIAEAERLLAKQQNSGRGAFGSERPVIPRRDERKDREARPAANL